MSVNHKGNTQPAIDQEEHEGSLEPATKRVLAYGYDGSAKQILKTDSSGRLDTTASISASTVAISSAPTLYAVVNTSAVGTTNSLATLLASNQWIGLVSAASIHGKVDLISSPTLYAVVNTGALGTTNSLVTLLNSTAQIGFATVQVANTVPVTGTFWQATQPVSVAATLNSLVTVNNFPATYAVTQSGTWDEVGINDSGNTITVDGTITANLAAGTNNIGDVDLASEIPLGTKFIGLVSTASIHGKVDIISSPTIFAVVNTGAAGVESSLATILNFPATYAVTQSGTWDEVGINDSGNTITVDGTVTANLAAGTNNIGDIDILTIAAGDNNIGNVDIVSVPALVASSAFIGLVSTASIHAKAEIVNTTLAVTQSGTWDEVGINDSGNTITVDGTITANLAAGTPSGTLTMSFLCFK